MKIKDKYSYNNEIFEILEIKEQRIIIMSSQSGRRLAVSEDWLNTYAKKLDA